MLVSYKPVFPNSKSSIVDFLVRFRWIFVIFVALPVTCAFKLAHYLNELWSETKFYDTRQQEHNENVKNVVKRLKQRNPAKDGLVCTGRKPYESVGMRNVDYKRARHFDVDLCALNNILGIDLVRMVARVEPLVTMAQITRVLIPMNLSLAVLPEFDDLTVGGLINAYGISGSSHIHGLFTDTVVSYEILLSDGCVVKATADNDHRDLFYAIPWSQGTLGLLVAAEIKLIRVKEYMRLTYTPKRGSLMELAEAFKDSFVDPEGDQDTSKKVPEFVETIIYSPTEAVCMTGRYASKEEATNAKGVKINDVGWWFKPWFYQHAQTALNRGKFVEYIPTRSYYHRHTRSLYWEAKLILPFGDQWWFRVLLGWLMPPKLSFLKATQSEAIRNYYHEKHVIQDMLVPLHKVADVLEFAEREFEIYPIWLCPHKLRKHPFNTMISPEPRFETHRRAGDTPFAQMYADVGLYYTPKAVFRGEKFDGCEASRKVEQWLIENHGFQALYVDTELNETDFWRMFDESLYNQCRQKYRAVGTLMGVYYKSKKGRKTEKEVKEEEQKQLHMKAT